MTTRGNGDFRTRLNGRLVWFLAVILFVLPFLLGGNRPMAWALCLTLLSAGTALYQLLLSLAGIEPRVTARKLPLLFGLYLIRATYMVFQTLPVAGYLPGGLRVLPEGVPVPATISLSSGDTILSLARWMNIGLIFWLSLQIGSNSLRARRFLSILFVIAATHALYGLALRYEFGDTILFAPKWAYLGSVTGGFVNRNSFATFLSIGVSTGIAVIAVILGDRMTTRRWSLFDLLTVKGGLLLPLSGLLIVVVALVATNSRMGLFAGLTGAAVTGGLLFADSSASPGRRRLRLGVLLAVALLLLAILGLYGITLIERLGSLEQSGANRMALYAQVREMILARPFSGYGGGTFEFAYPLFHRPPVAVEVIWDRAHSSYLGLWADYGLIFGSIPPIMIFMVLWRLIRFQITSSRREPVVAAAIGATVTVALHSLVDFSLEIHAVTLLYGSLMAAAMAATLNGRPASQDGA